MARTPRPSAPPRVPLFAIVAGLALAPVFVTGLIAPAAAVTPTSVALDWTAPGDNGGQGTAASYQIRYRTTLIGSDTTSWWNAATPVTSLPAPGPAGTPQTVTINGLTPSTTYYALIIALDEANNRSGYSNAAGWTTPADSATVIISNITTETAPGVLAVTIRWTTNIPSTSQVEYGVSISYGRETPLNPNLVTQHLVTLTSADISNDVLYNFRVKSGAPGGPVTVSGNRTFKVDAVAPSQVVDLIAN